MTTKVKKVFRIIRKHTFFLILVFLSTLFSYILMFHTFSYNRQTNHLLIASTCWSDFGSHLPLIRSFTYGANLTRLFNFTPPEYPHFPGEPIRYHFLFYMIVGILERLGLRIDYAFNIPSALGFTLLLMMIYMLAVRLFKSRLTGIISVIFFLFNGSFAVFSYLSKHPFSSQFFSDLISVRGFPSFGPWDGGLVSAFWNLNIYTNQRHLALSYGMALLTIYLALDHKDNALRRGFKQSIVIGSISGILLLMNQAAALIAILFSGWILLLKKEVRLLGGAVLGGLPFLFLYLLYIRPSSTLVIDPGYLVVKPLTLFSVIAYWLYNIGLHLILIPLGIALAPKKTRHLTIPLLVLFLVPNIIRFSPDMINNHKFFNFFIIVGAMFSAWFIKTLFFTGKNIWQTISFSIVSGVLVISLTASGLIDFLVIANDHKGEIPDIRANPDVQFFLNETRPDDVILNSSWFYHPASLAGRSIFSGYPYFTWSYGYDKDERENIAKHIYTNNKGSACNLLLLHKITFVELHNKPEYSEIDKSFWDTIPQAYINPSSDLKVYRTESICGI